MQKQIITFNEVEFNKRIERIQNNVLALNTLAKEFKQELLIGDLSLTTWELIKSSDYARLCPIVSDLLKTKLVNNGIPESSPIVSDAVSGAEMRVMKLANNWKDVVHYAMPDLGYIIFQDGHFGIVDNMRELVKREYEAAIETKAGAELYEIHRQTCKNLKRILDVLHLQPYQLFSSMYHLFDVSGDEVKPKAFKYDVAQQG